MQGSEDRRSQFDPLTHSAVLFHYSASDTHVCMRNRQNFVILSHRVRITDSAAVADGHSKPYFGCSCGR